MTSESPIWVLISTFGLMSLFAVAALRQPCPRCIASRPRCITG